LFSSEKLPGMFQYVDQGKVYLSIMGKAASNGDNALFEKTRIALHDRIDKSNINEGLKRDLKSATKAVKTYNPISAVSSVLQRQLAEQNLAQQQRLAAEQQLRQQTEKAAKQKYGTTQVIGTQNVPNPNQFVQNPVTGKYVNVKQASDPKQSTDGVIYNPNTGKWGYYVDSAGNKYTTQEQVDGFYSRQNQPNVEDYVQNLKQQIMSPIEEAAAKQQKTIEQYLKDNPTGFDEAWMDITRKQVSEEVNSDPYYKEKLDQYLGDIEKTKTRTQNDEQTFLKELDRQDRVYKNEEAGRFQEARMSALEGLSTSGNLDTGEGQRQLNLQNRDRQIGMEDYSARTDLQKKTKEQQVNRLIEDLDTNKTRFSTDVEREKQYNIQSGVQQRKTEKYNNWAAGFQKASGQVAPGYNFFLG
jgi:hypothetical protein